MDVGHSVFQHFRCRQTTFCHPKHMMIGKTSASFQPDCCMSDAGKRTLYKPKYSFLDCTLRFLEYLLQRHSPQAD